MIGFFLGTKFNLRLPTFVQLGYNYLNIQKAKKEESSVRPEQSEQNTDTQYPPKPQNEQVNYGSKLLINPISPLTSNDAQNNIADPRVATRPTEQPLADVDASNLPYSIPSEREETFAMPGVPTSNPIYPTSSNNQAPTAQPPRKKKHYIRNTLLTLITLFVGFIGLGIVGYMAGETVRASDLVESEFNETTYLRPDKWEKISTSTNEGYGDGRGKDGKSTALILVNRSDRTRLDSIANADAAMLNMARDTWMKAFEEQRGDMSIQNNSFGCKQLQNTRTEIDTQENATTIGLFTSASDCDMNGTPYKLKMRFILGRDGYIRTVAMMASEKSWEKNAEAFNKMYDSIKQS